MTKLPTFEISPDALEAMASSQAEADAALEEELSEYRKARGRAREKAASRAEDARAISSGQKSVAEVREANAAFAFPRERLRVDLAGARRLV
jgi:hypothetical protein